MNLRKQRRQNVEPDEIDITSLLDVLVILLVFLLKSFNSSDLTVDLVNNLALPYSLTTSIPQNGVVVQTNEKKEVYINNAKLTDLRSPDASEILIEKLEELKQDMTPQQRESKLINLVLDQNLTYKDVDSLLKIVEQAGFSKYKLLTQGKE